MGFFPAKSKDMKTLSINQFLFLFTIVSTFLVSRNAIADLTLMKDKKSHLQYIYQTNLTTDLHGSEQIEAHVYYPLQNSNKKIIYLTPTISGVTPLEKTLASFFVNKGYVVIIPLPFKSEIDNPIPDVKRLDEEFLKPAVVAKKLISDLENLLKINSNSSLFLVGASQGGFRSLVLASQINVAASWIVTAGSDFASIYSQSKVKKVVTFRENHMRALRMTDLNEYEVYMRENLTNDPSIICQKIESPFVQVIALKDTKVPTENQLRLINDCPAHKTIKLDVGHLKASLSTITVREKIHAYFTLFF